MTDLEKDKILLLAHSVGKMARELQSIKRLLKEIADTPQTDCETCRHYKLACELFSEVCKYEPTIQTETQNSNLTFEKDECAKEYEELGLKELKELINADRKTENCSKKPNNCERQTEGVWNAGYKTGYDKGYKDAQKVKDSQDLVKDLVKAFGEDGTWLERQGVYTLTLAEAKQRAVDIIESVTQTETQNSNSEFEKRTMRDCYNCKRYESEEECVECKYEQKQTDEPKTTDYCDVCNHKGCDNCIADGNNPYCVPSHYEPKDEPQTDCPWK